MKNTTTKKPTEIDKIVKILQGLKYTEAHNILDRAKEIILQDAVVQPRTKG